MLPKVQTDLTIRTATAQMALSAGRFVIALSPRLAQRMDFLAIFLARSQPLSYFR